jgi:hypothetical protein
MSTHAEAQTDMYTHNYSDGKLTNNCEIEPQESKSLLYYPLIIPRGI